MREANECNPRSLSLLSHDNSRLSRQVEPNAEPFSQNVFRQKNGLLATVHCTWSSTSDKSRETSGRYYHSVWCLCGMTGLKSIKTLKKAQRRCRPDKENLLNLDWKIMLKLSVENQFSAPVVVVRLLDKWRRRRSFDCTNGWTQAKEAKSLPTSDRSRFHEKKATAFPQSLRMGLAGLYGKITQILPSATRRHIKTNVVVAAVCVFFLCSVRNRLYRFNELLWLSAMKYLVSVIVM